MDTYFPKACNEMLTRVSYHREANNKDAVRC